MSGDVLIIGGGVSGLVAATYLVRAGKHVTLLEAQEKLGGFCALTSPGEGWATAPGTQTLYALDPRVVADLNLAHYGLTFTARDVPLVGLHNDGKHVVLQRDIHTTTASIAVHSAEDARAWPKFRRELFDLARAMRPLWWGEAAQPAPEALRSIERIAKTGAIAWLDSWFESDLLKTTLCFDATEGGLSPIEPGSALTLVWRAAQEMSGLQGAVAMTAGETLVASLVAAAQTAGVNIQMGARVVALLSDGETVSGARLESGEICAGSQIICSLSRREVSLTMLPAFASGIAQTTRYLSDGIALGQARVLLALRGPLRFGGVAVPAAARFILSESAGAFAQADFAARVGRLGDELPMEIVISPASDGAGSPGQCVVSMLLRPVPINPVEGWHNAKPKLAERAVQALERVAPGTAAQIAAAKVLAPDSADVFHSHSAGVNHLLAGYRNRIKSPFKNLLFCGADTEPVTAVSGRAARLAATTLTGRK